MRDYKRKDIYPNKKCLSSTQFLDYEKSPFEFHLEWCLPLPEGIEKKMSPAMAYGIAFSELYADRTFNFREFLKPYKICARKLDLMEDAIRYFPVLPTKNCEFELVCSHRKWKFRATLDGHHSDIIIENKTGEAEWTQERADLSDQITFQVWCYWKKHKELPKRVEVNWLDTRASSRQRLKHFVTNRSVEALKCFETRVNTVIENLEAGNFTTPIY